MQAYDESPENGTETPAEEQELVQLLTDELEPEGLEQADESEESEEENEEELEEEEGRRWFVIHTYSGYENKVETNLKHRIASMGVDDKIYDVVIPTEEQVEIKDGQRRTVQRKVFPGYVLVQ